MATNTEQTANEPLMLEYIWIDHFSHVRSKTKIITKPFTTVEDLPVWNYLNFHTLGQKANEEYVTLLKPVAVYPDPFRGGNHLLVLTEPLNLDGTPHYTNHRAKAVEIMNRAADSEPQFGVEQEYMIFGREFAPHEGTENGKPFLENKRIPYKWLAHNNPGGGPEAIYIHEVGGGKMYGRDLAEEHVRLCLKAGLKIDGMNPEATPSQWEYQVGICDGIELGDHLTVSRWILHRVSEKYEAHISLKARPYKGPYFGSGLHTNFSTKQMREGADGKTGLQFVEEGAELLCKKENHDLHIPEYGDNTERLNGGCCVGDLDTSNWSRMDRDCSIRIPAPTVVDGKGYLEDRRPAADADPYRIIARIVQTVVLKE